MTKGKDFKQLETFMKSNDNTVCLSLVHHLYGPLRGCNFIIKSEAKAVANYLDSYPDDMNKINSDSEMVAMLEEIRTGKTPKTLLELCTKTWMDTGLQVTMQILPPDVYKNAENPPNVVESFEEGQKEILMQLAIGKAMKDPFFFRMGII